LGSGPPKGVKWRYPPKVPHPKIFKSPFLKIVKNVVHQKLNRGDPLSEECKFWILSRSDHRFSGKTSHRWNWFLGFGGKTPFPNRKWDPRNLWARVLTIFGGKNFDPRKPEVGDFLSWPKILGPPGSAPNGGRGSWVMPFGRSRLGVRSVKNFRKSQFRVPRKFDF